MKYVTEISPEPPELQVMHKYPMTEPEVKPADDKEQEGRKSMHVDVTCRWRGCGERSPRPMSTKDGSNWIMSHGEQAHGNPYVGAKWTPVREPGLEGDDRELEAG